MRRLMAMAVAAGVMVGCDGPQATARPGDGIYEFHVRDAQTGKCIDLREWFSSNKWTVTVADDRECQQKGKDRDGSQTLR